MKTLNKNKMGVGAVGYLNKNCWLIKNLNYAPYRRCQYCELRFRDCLFLRYQSISSVLITFFLALFFLVEGRISTLVIILIFSLVIIYGYYFNKSTEKIIKASFAEKQAREAFQDLSDNLRQKVNEQTKDLLQINKELKTKNQLNQELLNIKSDFLRVVNHQLNTPLSVMNSSFSMMKEGDYSREQGMTVIEAGLQRINQTVSDFWSAYELEGEKMKMEPEKTDIAVIIDKLIAEKQKLKLAQDRKLKLLVQKPNFPMPLVWCDPKKISHIISNLLDNAVFYTTQGEVTVSYELTGKNYLKINVQDTGAGLAEKDKAVLFQKFSRGLSAAKLQSNGSGLGLYIAKKIVEGNDGEINCFSKGVNQGSTFSFTIPVFTSQQVVTKAEGPVGREKKIVIFKQK